MFDYDQSIIIEFLNYSLIYRDISLWPFLINFLSSTTFILLNFFYEKVDKFDEQIFMKIFRPHIVCQNTLLDVHTKFYVSSKINH